MFIPSTQVLIILCFTFISFLYILTNTSIFSSYLQSLYVNHRKRIQLKKIASCSIAGRIV